jgi:hypothetical protein
MRWRLVWPYAAVSDILKRVMGGLVLPTRLPLHPLGDLSIANVRSALGGGAVTDGRRFSKRSWHLFWGGM